MNFVQPRLTEKARDDDEYTQLLFQFLKHHQKKFIGKMSAYKKTDTHERGSTIQCDI